MRFEFDWGVRAGWAVPMQHLGKVETDFFLGFRDSQITFAGPFRKSLIAKSKKYIHAPNMVLIPGLINAHTHLAMTLFRGLEDDVALKTWLFERIFPLEAKFVSPAFVTSGTELAALECIRFGTTTVSDMYYFPLASISVWQKRGLRGLFSQNLMSLPSPEDASLGTDRFARFLKMKKKFTGSEQIRIGLAPHAPYTCDEGLLKKIAQVSRETLSRIHIHLSESAHEVTDSVKQNGKTPVQYLCDLGLLGPLTVCAHAVHLSKKDRALLKRSGAHVVHNPDSNLKLGSGVAPVVEYLADGITVAIGTDGSASNNDLSLFGAMDLATKAQKLVQHDNTAMTAAQALWMATRGGAKALGWDDQIGSLEVGKQADFVLVDFEFPHLQPVYDPLSHLVYAASGLEVDTVFCGGRPLLRDKKFVGLDARSIFKKAESYRKKIADEVVRLRAKP